MTESVEKGCIRVPFRPLALVLLLASVAACYRNWPEPRRGMDVLRCPQDSTRMAYVVNRGPGEARLMTRRYPGRTRDQPIDLAVLESGRTGEYAMPDSIMVFSYDGATATPVPREHAPSIPPAGAPRPQVEIEYFCR